MSRINLGLLCAALVVLWPSSVHAQVKDPFIQGVADFVNAANGLSGDEGPALTAATGAMAQGLAQWDAAITKVETGLASQIGGAPPAVAARMRATLGAVYLDRGRVDEALQQFDAAVALDADVRDVATLRGLAYERTNQPANAVGAYRSAVKQEPGDIATAYLLLRATATTADRSETSAVMKTVVEAAEKGTAGRAPQFPIFDLIDEASVPAPIFVPAAYSEAAALLTQAKYGEAIAWLRRSAETSLSAARDERSRLASADARAESGDLAGAQSALTDAIRAFPQSGLAHWKLGRLALRLGDDAAALRSFQSAAALPSLGGAAHVYASIARIQHNQLDLDGASSAYSRRVALTPNDATAHDDLADVYRAQDRFDEALVEYSIAALLDTRNTRALAGAAQVHAAAGRDEAALGLLRRVVMLDPEHREARYALGRALMRLGRTDEARRELQAFEELQQKAMQDERRRFQENQIKIDEALKSGGAREPAR